MYFMPRRLRALTVAFLLSLFCLGGCASTNPRDPFESMNRAVYSFNDGVDTAIVRPIAEGYRAVLPSFVRTGVSNFFANINDVLVALNNLLQGKIVNAISDVGRVVVNTTVGLAGLFDVATEFGLEKHNEDFGQTLGYWGVGDGPYLILPFLGPSNLRDTVGRFVDTKLDPVGYVRSMRLRNSLWGLRTLSHRADLLDTSRILETAALDPYEFLRDAYLQRRRNLVHDGAPPREKDDDAELNFKPGAKPAAGAANTVAPAIQPTNFTTLATEDQTPARTAAQEPIAAPVVELQLLAAQWSEPVAAPVELAIKPKTEVIAPVAPTPASPAAELQTPASRVIRVWASAAQ